MCEAEKPGDFNVNSSSIQLLSDLYCESGIFHSNEAVNVTLEGNSSLYFVIIYYFVVI